MRTSMRLATSALTGIAIGAAANLIFGELAVRYEMQATHVLSRAELSGDFGLGLLGMLVVLPSAVVFGIATSWLTWRHLTRRTLR